MILVTVIPMAKEPAAIQGQKDSRRRGLKSRIINQTNKTINIELMGNDSGTLPTVRVLKEERLTPHSMIAWVRLKPRLVRVRYRIKFFAPSKNGVTSIAISRLIFNSSPPPSLEVNMAAARIGRLKIVPQNGWRKSTLPHPLLNPGVHALGSASKIVLYWSSR